MTTFAAVWDQQAAIDMLPDLLRGLVVTVEVTVLSFILSLVVGLVVAVIRHARIPGLAQLFTAYVLFVRGTPLLVQAYFAYFVLPDYGLTFSPFVTGVLVLGINYSAYTAEVYRGGIEGVPTGQWEACTALSLPARRTWMRIVLPQMVRTIIPVLGNYLIQMFKDSAILSAITVMEMLSEADKHLERPLEAFTLVGILFLLVSYPSSLLFKSLERRFATSH